MRRALLTALVEGDIISRIFLQRGNEVTVGCAIAAAAVAIHGCIAPVNIIILQTQIDRAGYSIDHPSNDRNAIAALHLKITGLNTDFNIGNHFNDNNRLADRKGPGQAASRIEQDI